MSRVANSVAYLRAEYGLGTNEALRRLSLQGRAAGIDAQLAKAYPSTYAGLWIDQRDGGTLHINATNPATLAKTVATLPDQAHVKLVQVKYSLAQLSAQGASLATKLGSAADVVVDPTADRVIVYQRAGAVPAGHGVRTPSGLNTAEKTVVAPDARVNAAVAAAHGEALLRQLVLGQAKSGVTALAATTTCTAISCPAPLRGGFRLDVQRTVANNDPDNKNPLWGECTSGFNVVDTAGTAYLMTAGHCAIGSDKNGVNKAYSTAGVQISTEDLTHEQDAYPLDYSIQPVASPSVWKPAGQVMDFCWPTVQTWTRCETTSLGVKSYIDYASVIVGTVVCATGTGSNDADGYTSSVSVPGTRCGEVTGVNGGIVTNICSRKGDSGGPLFSEVTQQAYGILNDGTAGSGACPTSPPGTEWSQYAPVSKIMTAVGAGFTLEPAS